MKKYKLIAICGEAGSGKDTVLKTLVKKYPNIFHAKVSCTTRPPREGEQDGLDYYFLKEEQFKSLKNNMIETACFNNWYYGTLITELKSDMVNVGIFTPSGISQLLGNNNIDLTVIYLFTPAKERLLRQLNREHDPDVHEIIRRFQTDETDFKNIENIPDIKVILNGDNELLDAVNSIYKFTLANLD